MRFSIIVPVYNVELYLDQCVTSILKQKFTDFEVLLIDDGSTDRSAQMCDSYAKSDPRVRVFHKDNGGLSDARNKGIEFSTGEYLLFVDSDDWISDNCLETFDKVLSKDGEPDVLLTRLAEVYGEQIKAKDTAFYGYLQESFDHERAISWILTKSENTWPAVLKIVSRKLVMEKNLRFEYRRLHEDIDWTVNLCLVAKSYSGCAQLWYYHRMSREGAITNTVKAKNVIDVLEMTLRHQQLCEQKEDALHKLAVGQMAKAAYYYFTQTRYCSEDTRKEIVQYAEDHRKEILRLPALTRNYQVIRALFRILGFRRTLSLLSLIK